MDMNKKFVIAAASFVIFAVVLVFLNQWIARQIDAMTAVEVQNTVPTSKPNVTQRDQRQAVADSLQDSASSQRGGSKARSADSVDIVPEKKTMEFDEKGVIKQEDDLIFIQ